MLVMSTLANRMLPKINVGCGMTPTPGWINYDNSPAIGLSRLGSAVTILERLGVLDDNQVAYIRFCAEHEIKFGDGTRLPLSPDSVSAVYTSHMLEHLDREQASVFLMEAYRVLAPGGILRVAVPDLRRKIDDYLETGDANQLMEDMRVCSPAPRGLVGRIKALVVGPRHHLWMYDTRSLVELLVAHKFSDVNALRPGQTNIENAGALNLREREYASIYVEGRKPLGVRV
jgi:SAM-dependent methyltransferase